MELTKYLCHVYMLAYFHKDSVTSCHKKEEIKKDCDN